MSSPTPAMCPSYAIAPTSLVPGPLGDLGREAARVLRSADRRALRPDSRDAAVRGPPARVDVDRDPDRRGAAPRGGLDQVEVRRLVDDQRRVSVGTLGGEQRQLGERLAIGRRVADEDVLVALAREVERLGQGEAQDPAEAVVEAEDPLEHLRRAHGLRGDPHRQGRGLRSEHVRVRAHRVQVDEREWRRDALEDRVVAALQPLEVCLGCERPRRGEPISRIARVPGEVAEWLKALAC